jgi:hypothetical protein
VSRILATTKARTLEVSYEANFMGEHLRDSNPERVFGGRFCPSACSSVDDASFASFLPRETDFNVTLQVSDLTNESDLGTWIVRLMQIITAIPREQLVGPLPGRVFLIFQSGRDHQELNFGVDQFQNLPSNLSDAEIFQALQVPQ